MFSPDDHDHSICFFCRTEDKSTIEEFLQDNPIKGLGKVLSLGQVKKIYSAFKDRKALLSEQTHFVCDSRIMTHLYNILGKVFGSRNNYPVPVTVNGKDKLMSAIEKAVHATYMHLKGVQCGVLHVHSS